MQGNRVQKDQESSRTSNFFSVEWTGLTIIQYTCTCIFNIVLTFTKGSSSFCFPLFGICVPFRAPSCSPAAIKKEM